MSGNRRGRMVWQSCSLLEDKGWVGSGDRGGDDGGRRTTRMSSSQPASSLSVHQLRLVTSRNEPRDQAQKLAR